LIIGNDIIILQPAGDVLAITKLPNPDQNLVGFGKTIGFIAFDLDAGGFKVTGSSFSIFSDLSLIVRLEFVHFIGG
jgi:hypothetical protein